MRIITETSLRNFDAWSGAESTLNRVIAEGYEEALEAILEDAYPDGMTDTELNDLLWFESDTIFDWLDMETESSLNDKIAELEDELEELRDVEDIDDLDTDRIGEIENELDELQEELDRITSY